MMTIYPAVPVADFVVEDHGSIALLRPQHEAAQRFIEERVCGEHMFFGSALVVEPRYLLDLIEGLQDDGFEVA